MSISSDHCHFVFKKAERDLLKLSSSLDQKSVHGIRTSARRVQTLLEELMPKRDRNQKKLLKVLREIRKRAGKVRDLDVQLAALRSLKIPQEPRRKTQLTQRLIDLRSKHEKKTNKVLTKNVLRDIQKRLKRASKTVMPETARNPLLVAREILARVKQPKGPLTEDVLHEYRRAVKTARYAAEFAPESAEATQLIAQLKHLQDAIGDWHDWLTLTQTAAAHLNHGHHSSLVAALRNVTGGKFRRAVTAIAVSPTVQTPVRLAATPYKQTRKVDGVGSPLQSYTSSAA